MSDPTSPISGLSELAEAPAADDLFPFVDVSDPTQAPSGTTKRITVGWLLAEHPARAGGTTATAARVPYRNAKDFATADGVTNDTAALNAAAAAAVGGKLIVPGGIYRIDDLASLPSGIVIEGEAIDDVIFKILDGVVSRGLLIQNVAHVVVRNITIDMNSANTVDGGVDTQQLGIYMVASNATGLSGVTIENVRVINAYYAGFRSTSSTTAQPHRVTIRDCEATDTKYGFHCTRPGGVVVKDNHFEDITAEGILVSGGSAGDPGSTVSITRNRLIACASGGIATTTSLFDFQITDNYVTGVTGSLKWGIAVSVQCHDFVVSGNVVSACQEGGITIDPKVDGDDTIQEANGVVANNVSYAAITSHGINTNYVTKLSLIGNVCYDNAGSGIRLTSKGLAVTGNHCYDNDKGIAGSETVTPFGGHVLSGNHVHDNTTSQVSIEQTTPSSIDDNTVIVVKAADETVNNVAVSQADDELLFPVQLNETWVFEFCLVVNGGAAGATADFRAALDVPTGATFMAMAVSPGSGATVATAASSTHKATSTDDGDMTNLGLLDSANVIVRIAGSITNGTTAGNVVLKWAQSNATVSDTTVKAKSFLKAHRMVA